MVIVKVGGLCGVSKKSVKWIGELGVDFEVAFLQKITLLGTERILKQVN